MDDDQPSAPAEPWVSRSAWTLAPALFFYELLLGLVWLFTLGLLFDPLLLSMTFFPALSYFVYRFGVKCATEERAPRVSRWRLWGASVLVGFIHCFFLFLLVKDQLNTDAAQHPEQAQQFMDTVLGSSSLSAEQQAQLTPEVLRTMVSLSFAMIFSLGLFLLHWVALWVGVRSVEKVRS